MSIPRKTYLIAPLTLVFSVFAQAPDPVPLKNWPAPLSWQPTTQNEMALARNRETAENRMEPRLQTAGTPVNVLVAITPCRLVDTRVNMPQPFGSGSSSQLLWSAGSTHTIPAPSGSCSLPAAAAYSANITIVVPSAGAILGFLAVYPTGTSRPQVSTLNDFSGLPTVANAAVIPTGTPAGSFDVYVTDAVYVVIDINGYYVSPSALSLGTSSATAPALTFGTDSTSGVYSSGSGTVGVATGGTSRLTVDANGNVGIGTTSAGSKLDVSGDINMAGSLYYQGSPALQMSPSGEAGSTNLFVGLAVAPLNNTGIQNTGVGFSALSHNTIGTGNTALGHSSLLSNTSGSFNTANGNYALANNLSGQRNVALGVGALQTNSSGSSNMAIGYHSLFFNNNDQNVALGESALMHSTSGSQNTAIGSNALLNNDGGSSNIAIGSSAGSAVTAGSFNIHLGNAGVAGDNAVIRMGTAGSQTSFFAAGIRGITTATNDAIPVVISSSGQLGTVSSSRRFKEDITDMGQASSPLLRLRPVTFRYRSPYADGSKPIQYGLVAEEVAEVFPDLVAHSADGQIESVKYQVLDSMLLNEFQKEHEVVNRQAEEIRLLQSRLETLERLLAAKTPLQ